MTVHPGTAAALAVVHYHASLEEPDKPSMMGRVWLVIVGDVWDPQALWDDLGPDLGALWALMINDYTDDELDPAPAGQSILTGTRHETSLRVLVTSNRIAARVHATIAAARDSQAPRTRQEPQP